MGIVENDAHRFAPAAPESEYVYGACCPGWHTAAGHDTAVSEWISFMQAAGIERVCCLLAGPDADPSDANLGPYYDAFGRERVKHAPVPDQRLVCVTHLREAIFPFLEAAVDHEEPTVVHCLAGVGRTGQVLAAWLVYHHDYDPAVAVDTLRERGRDPTEIVDRTDVSRHDLLAVLGEFA